MAKRYTDEQVLRFAESLVETGDSTHLHAEGLCIPQSTLYWQLRNRIPKLDKDLYEKVKLVLRKNRKYSHPTKSLGGGQASKSSI